MPPIPNSYRRNQKHTEPSPVRESGDSHERGEHSPPCPGPSPEGSPEGYFVYCLTDLVRVKFGKCQSDPRSRVRCKQLQTGHPLKLYLVAFAPSSTLSEEGALRRYGETNHQGGGREWRRISWQLIEDITSKTHWKWYDEQVVTWLKASLYREACGV